ncbi:tolloid-like protein 2 [Oculina patagonica]
MDCNYSVPIPHGMAIKITFHAFDVQYDSPCRYDYMNITNDHNKLFGVICGKQSGLVVNVTGSYVVLTFHSDAEVQKGGFLLLFTVLPLSDIKECGSVVNNTLTSPGYPNNYPGNMDCEYLIPIPHGMALKITFGEFHMEYDSSCKFDYLKITNERRKSFGIYCGGPYRKNATADANGNYAKLKFHSDSDLQKRGFLLYFSTFPLPGCGSVINNTLTSPNYPNNYPNNMDCKYSLHLRPGMAVYMNFHDFEVDYDSSEQRYCVYDYFMVSNDRGNEFGEYCGSKSGTEIFVPGTYDQLTFYSDFTIQERGFNISFTFVDCGPRCSFEWDRFDGHKLTCWNLTTISILDVVKCFPRIIPALALSSSKLSILPVGVFSNLTALRKLDLSLNNIQNFTGDVFSPLKRLYKLYLTSNNIQDLSADMFSSLKSLETLYLDSNNIHTLDADVFAYLTKIDQLHLESNNITKLDKNAFSSIPLLLLWISFNNIENLPSGLFSNASKLFLLDLSHNKIKYLPKNVFWGLNATVAIYLQDNMITSFSNDAFADNPYFRKIFLTANRLENIPRGGFYFRYDAELVCVISPCDRTIMLSDNPIKTIEPEAFNVDILLTRIYLLRTKLKVLSLEFFSGFGGGVLDSRM